jgi:DNA-binding response OmpR family regulator
MDAPLKHILVVEDDADSSSALSEILKIQGYNVITAQTGKEARSLIKSYAFNLYLLDIILPDGSGLDLCKQICRIDRHAPVIFLSVLANDEAKQADLAAGAAAYLTKPADLEILLETIDTLINKDDSS